jgi:hypothetical protein
VVVYLLPNNAVELLELRALENAGVKTSAGVLTL